MVPHINDLTYVLYLFPDAGGLQDPSVPQLNQDFVRLEQVRAL